MVIKEVNKNDHVIMKEALKKEISILKSL